MRTEREIRKLLGLMIETYEHGSPLSDVESPADAYNSAETLKWVLGEKSVIEELFSHSGGFSTIEEWLKDSRCG